MTKKLKDLIEISQIINIEIGILDKKKNETETQIEKELEIILKDFFSKNKVQGETITEFYINSGMYPNVYEILLPGFDEDYWDENIDKLLKDMSDELGIMIKMDSSMYSK